MAEYLPAYTAWDCANKTNGRLLSFAVGYIGTIKYLGTIHDNVILLIYILVLLLSQNQTTLATVLANAETLSICPFLDN